MTSTLMGYDMITQLRLQELFDYCDGQLVWKISRTGSAKAGGIAGSLTKRGYIVVSADGKLYKLHRLVFLMHHGYMPQYVDHIDRNKSNNRIENLREATNSQNRANSKLNCTSYTGFKGVHFHKPTGKWQAKIGVNRKRVHLGLYGTAEEAYVAYCDAAKHYFGDYANI